MKTFLEKNYKIIAGIILMFILIVSLLNAWNDSAIFDETAHIGAAYSYVTQQEIRLNPEHPPLIKDLAGLPLLFLNLNFSVDNQPFWKGTLPGKWDEGQWVSGRYLLYGAGNNSDAIIFWARLPIVLLSLLLGLFIFKWGKELAGTISGLIAFILYAFDPNILGHNHFVTTDLGIAAAFTFCLYFYLKFIKHPTWKNITLAGLFLGILEITKFSFFIVYPVIGLATLVYPLVSIIPNKAKNGFIFRIKKLGEYASKGVLVFGISMVVVWAIYFINTYNMSPAIVDQVIDANFSPAKTDNASNITMNHALHWMNNNPIARPLTDWGIGVGYVFRRVAGGNGAYFMGQVSSQAFPLYFPVVFLIKETLPFIALIFFSIFFTSWAIGKSIFTIQKNLLREGLMRLITFLRTHIVEWSLFLFIAIYIYISVTGNLNIGLRHLFPIFPFIYILVARSISRFVKMVNPQSQKIFRIIFATLLFLIVAETMAAYPYYMSYFNATVGGPKNGYHYVTDSNADWGQDLKRLKDFLNNHPDINAIHVDYFGGGDIKTYIGDKYLMWWDSKRPIEPGWYAISTNFLQGSLYDTQKPDNESYRWLKNKKPAYQVGTSILIYYITPEEATTVPQQQL